ncbi:MAG: cation:proton antiporter, partial [Verrucomicrobia bacterium]|nr:cation:proton antiporter [Verrucomicrobiota bacterium]
MGELGLLQDLAVVTLAASVAGFCCQRLGLSSVVGFLLAGLIVGPHTPPFSLISDEARIDTLSQLGLVFLMFSIGLELSLGKLRRMGPGLVVAVALGAVLVFGAVRSLVCPWLGIGALQAWFVAGMLMASSSAIIGKVLPETGLIHQRAGNLAMSITVLEDLVAVVVLTLIGSIGRMKSGPEAHLGRALGVLLVFVTLLVVLGLLLLPRLLRRLNRAGTDLLTVTVAGLALGIAVIAVKIGYSLALGAFLLGAIIAETPQRPTVERAMQGMRDLFIAVFFVSIGMLLDPVLLAKDWVPILSLGIAAIVVRALALSVALIITGTPDWDAIRAGLMVTPVGEFAFIIVQAGVSAQLLSADYYPVAIGMALFTAVVSPVLIQHSAEISNYVVDREPKFLRELLTLYQQFLAAAGERQQRSRVWRLAKEKLPLCLVSMLFASGILVFAPLLLRPWEALFAQKASTWRGGLFWSLVGVAITVPLLGAWRKLAEFLIALADLAFGTGPRTRLPLRDACLELVSAGLLLVWVWDLVPVREAGAPLIGAIVATTALAVLVFGKRLTAVQHQIDSQLADAILSAEERRQQSREHWLKEHQEWELTLSEIRVPDSEAWFDKSLGDLALRSRFGCSVIGVERQGYPVPSPGPDTAIFPNDMLSVLGTKAQIQRVRAFFDSGPTNTEKSDILDEVRLESLEVLANSRLAGNALAELELPRHTGVQIVGISRGEHRMLFPGPFQVLLPGDWLLVVGTRAQLRHFREWSKEIGKDIDHDPQTA